MRAQGIVDAGRRLVQARDDLIAHLNVIGDHPTEAREERQQKLCRRLEQASRDLDEVAASVRHLMEEAVRKHGATSLVAGI